MTTSPGSRVTSGPRTEAITRTLAAVSVAAAGAAFGVATSSKCLLEPGAVRVADGHGERVRRVVRRGRLGQREQRAHHPLYLVLGGRPAPADRLLHRLGCVREARYARHAAREKHDPAGLA